MLSVFFFFFWGGRGEAPARAQGARAAGSGTTWTRLRLRSVAERPGGRPGLCVAGEGPRPVLHSRPRAQETSDEKTGRAGPPFPSFLPPQRPPPLPRHPGRGAGPAGAWLRGCRARPRLPQSHAIPTLCLWRPAAASLGSGRTVLVFFSVRSSSKTGLESAVAAPLKLDH